MRSPRFAARALALSLVLTAAGTFCMVAPASAVETSQVGNPVGGRQLGASGVIVNLAPGVPPPPAMPGASFVLADMDTGQILVARAPHALHLPASTLKTLTALTLIPLMDANTKILVKPQDVNAEGTRVGLMAGTSYSVGTLMAGMLITSGNDAAYALARGNQSLALTLREMNAVAAHLGASDTVAMDPSGLDRAGQSSSAYDLALIGRAAMRLADFRRYVSTKQTSLPGGRSADGKLRPGFNISNHNTLLHNYQGAIGIKNGYTVAARFTYIEAATRGGRTYLLTEMSSPQGGWRPAAAMLDWAFAHGRSLTPIGELVEPREPVATKPTVAVAAHPLALPQAPPPRSARARAVTPWIGVAAGVGALALALAVSWALFRRKAGPGTSHELQ